MTSLIRTQQAPVLHDEPDTGLTSTKMVSEHLKLLYSPVQPLVC